MSKPRIDQFRECFRKSPTRESLLSRRQVLKGLFGAGVLAVAGVENYTNVSLPCLASDLVTEDQYDERVESGRANLKERYNCSIRFSEVSGKVPLDRKHNALDNLKSALSKYPPELIKILELKILIKRFLKDEYDKSYLGGQAARAGKKRSPIILLSDVSLGEGTFHHELSHTFDGMDTKHSFQFFVDRTLERSPNLDLNRSWGELKADPEFKKLIDFWGVVLTRRSGTDGPFRHKSSNNDSDWKDLNTANQQDYTRSYSYFDRLIIKVRNGFTRPSGFARDYGLINENEDQATAHELLMIDTKKAGLLGREDLALAQKIAKIKEYFKHWTIGRMDEQYWKDLESGKVNEDYWDNKSLSF